MYTLEKGGIEDSERIHQVHTSAIRQLCSSHYEKKEISIWAEKQKPETYKPFLESGKIIVAKKSGIVVGFIDHIEHTKKIKTNESCSKQCSNNELEIKGLFIDPNFSSDGVGSLLFKKVEAIALEKGVAIMKVSASLNSLPFYRKMGFEEVERKLHQLRYDCSIECVRMVKNLTK